MSNNEIKVVGNYIYDGSQCGVVVDIEGIVPTISAGVHGYCNANIIIEVKDE